MPPKVPATANTNSPARLIVPVAPDENALPVPLAADCRSTVLTPDTSSVMIRYVEAAGNVTVILSLTASAWLATPDSVTRRSPLPSEMSLATASMLPWVSVPVIVPVEEVPVSSTVAMIRSPAATPPVRHTVTEPDVCEVVE